MDRKYTAFVSSTYKDLKDEREAVSKAILEIGHIPVGMEMFSAGDEQQWQLIRRQIDQSDYYVVIVAHQYGSTLDRISYTEREYDYAVQAGVPVLGFVIESDAEWPGNWIEKEPEACARLEAFREKVKSRMVSFWRNADALNAKVLAGLAKEMARNPRPGWLRGTEAAGPEVLAELSRLSKENAELRERVKATTAPDLAFSMLEVLVYNDEQVPDTLDARVRLLVTPRSGIKAMLSQHRCVSEIVLGGQRFRFPRIVFSSHDLNISGSSTHVVVDGPGYFSIHSFGVERTQEFARAEAFEVEISLGIEGYETICSLKASLIRSTEPSTYPRWVYREPNFLVSRFSSTLLRYA